MLLIISSLVFSAIFKQHKNRLSFVPIVTNEILYGNLVVSNFMFNFAGKEMNS